MFKKLISLFIGIYLFFNFPSSLIFANSDVLYTEKKPTQIITSGVTYDYSQRLYKSGWKDVYVLTVDVQNPNVTLDVVSSKTEHGLKKSTQNLLNENGAIAGVNGDFFATGNPKSAMGQVFKNGIAKEAQNYYNHSSNKYAGVFFGQV